MSDESTRNSIDGVVSGTSIQARDIAGGVSITQVFGDLVPEDRFGASELSAAVPEVVTVQHIRGRDELLASLIAVVDEVGGRIVLCGAGGFGKTALAYTIARELRSRRTVWWVDATTRETMVTGLFEVAVQAGASRAEAREVWHNGESAKDLLWRALHGPAVRPWMLVVDNADDPAMLDGWIRKPEDNNTVLITSRDQNPGSWARDASLHTVLPVTDIDGAAILTELAPEAGSASDARSLTRRLGGVPIALTLVGKYLAKTSIHPVLPESYTPVSFADYESDLDAEFPTAISRVSDGPHDVNLSHIWERSLDFLDRSGVAMARPLLRLIAFFAQSSLPVAVLRTSVLKHAPHLFPDVEGAQLEAALAGLIGLGLLRHDREDAKGQRVDALGLHSLVREVTRAQPDAVENSPVYLTMRIALLRATALELDPTDHRTWPEWRLLLPHCTFGPLDLEYARGDEYLLHSDVANKAAQYTRLAGLWNEAEKYYCTALTLRLRRPGPADPGTLAIRHNLAYLKRDQGRLSEAESDLVKIADDTVVILGADHPNTLATRHELARVMRDLGKVDLAENEAADLVSEMASILGDEHENTLAARHEHARSLHQKGLLDDAKAEFESLILTAINVLGETSEIATNARYELASVMWSMGDFSRAQRQFEAVLELEIQTLGSEHPSTLVTRAKISQVRVDNGEIDDAEVELRHVLAAWSRIGYENHPHALAARNVLAGVMMTRGDLSASETEFRHIAAATEAALGADHAETIQSWENVAFALQAQGKLVDAESELRRLLAGIVDVYGVHSQATITARHQLGDVLYKSGQIAAAEVEFRHVVEAQTQLLGSEHPDVLVTRSRAAAMTLIRGDAAAARTELGSLVAVLGRALGVADTRSLAARINFAYACGLVGEVSTAVSEIRGILTVCQGIDDLDETAATARAMLRQLGI